MQSMRAMPSASGTFHSVCFKSRKLAPVQTPLMLKKGEWCAHAVKCGAYEERRRTGCTNYAGPKARDRIMKGVYYRAGSIQSQRLTESYQHSFGDGVLGATNNRLIWVSLQKSLSIPLDKTSCLNRSSTASRSSKITANHFSSVSKAPIRQPWSETAV